MRLPRLLPWLALAAAFSPAIVEIVRHLGAEPWALYVLWFALLVPRAIRRDAESPRANTAGFALLALAMLLQLLTVGGEFVRFARPAVPLAIIGLCVGLGIARARVALLACWCVPVPALLLTVATPALEHAQLAVVGGGLAALGLPLEISGTVVRAGQATLAIEPGVNGIATAALLSGLGWYAGLWRGDPLPLLVRRAAVWGACAVPIQLVALGIALGMLPLAGSGSALALLLGLHVPLGVVGLLRIERADVGLRQAAR